MRDLILAFWLLLIGFVALQKRAMRDPFDYRKALLVDTKSDDSLSYALDKALVKKVQSGAIKVQSEPR